MRYRKLLQWGLYLPNRTSHQSFQAAFKLQNIYCAVLRKGLSTSASTNAIRKFSQKVKPYDTKEENLQDILENSQRSKNETPETANSSKHSLITSENKDMQETELDDDDDDDYGSALLDYYIKKAKEDIDNMDDVDYHDIQDVNQRVFYKIVDLWLKEVGSTKRGYREFIRVLLNSLSRFNVQHEINAYLKLLDCFPAGKHTGIKRDHWFRAALQDRIADHTLGLLVVSRILTKAVPNDKLFNKVTDLFGRFSPVTQTARRVLFWYPKIVASDPHAITTTDFKKMTPVDIALHGLRQINPGVASHYHHFAVEKSRCDEVLEAGKIDSIISVQTDKQIALLAKHDPSTPVFIEGPYITYFKTKTVQYYVMRSDPKLAPKSNVKVKPLTTKEWWVEFYDTDWKTGRKPANKIEENFFPTVNVGEPYYPDKIKETRVVENDTKQVEGPVYAIACSDYKSPEALLAWVRGLVPQNPVLRECSVLVREDEAFLLNAPKTDPNESFYETVEMPDQF